VSAIAPECWPWGAAALALRGIIDVDALSGWSERRVEAMRIGIGLWICHAG